MRECTIVAAVQALPGILLLIDNPCQQRQVQFLQPQQRLITLQVLLAEPATCDLRRLGGCDVWLLRRGEEILPG